MAPGGPPQGDPLPGVPRLVCGKGAERSSSSRACASISSIPMTRAAVALVLDGEAGVQGALEPFRTICISFVSSFACGLHPPERFPVIAVAERGSGGAHLTQLVLDPRQPSLDAWAAELSRILASAGATHGATGPSTTPCINALTTGTAAALPARVVFCTTATSSSCAEATLRHVLPLLERQGRELELLLVDRAAPSGTHTASSLLPDALVLLQAELAFSATALPDRLAASAWVAERLAQGQTIGLSVALVDGSELKCALLPSLLHEDVCTDALACVCHDEPLDGRHVALTRHLAAAMMRQPLCPVTNLALDRRDVRCVGCAGRFLWRRGASFASSAAALDDDPTNVLRIHEPLVPADGLPARPRLDVRAMGRVSLSQLELASLYGHAWRLIPASSTTTDAPTRGANAEDHATLLDEHAALLHALASQLHDASDALLCRVVHRHAFAATALEPLNSRTLLAPSVVLLPTGPPYHSLLLKAVGSPAQQVPLPRALSASGATDPMEAERAASAAAHAAQLLGSIERVEHFNPLHHCAEGASALLARCCASHSNPSTTAAPATAVPTGHASRHPPAAHPPLACMAPQPPAPPPPRQHPHSFHQPQWSNQYACASSVDPATGSTAHACLQAPPRASSLPFEPPPHVPVSEPWHVETLSPQAAQLRPVVGGAANGHKQQPRSATAAASGGGGRTAPGGRRRMQRIATVGGAGAS